MLQNYQSIAFKIPDGLQTYTIESGDNVLVIREPIAADYLLVESLKDNPNSHERAFALAERLALTWNGQAGVSIVEIGMLNRQGYKQLFNLCTQFFLDIIGDIGQEYISQFISNKREEFQQSGSIGTITNSKNSVPN